MAQTHTYTHIVCCFCNVFPLFPGVLQAGDQSSKRDSLHRIMAYALLVQLQVSCEWVRKWVTKNSAESENVHWIMANTKPCPRCSRCECNSACTHAQQKMRGGCVWLCVVVWFACSSWGVPTLHFRHKTLHFRHKTRKTGQVLLLIC